MASGLTEGVWEENPERTLLCLVNAFMEDIRAHYRNPIRRFLGMGPASSCVLLIGNVTPGNGGYQLLRAINKVRNRTGLSDPLLMVAHSQRLPAFVARSAGALAVKDAQKALDGWRNRISHGQRTGTHTAWYLPLTLPALPDDDKVRRQRQLELDAAHR